MSMQRVHLAEVRLPYQVTIHGQAVEPVRAEEGEQVLTVGHWRVGRQAGGVMTPCVREFLSYNAFPEDLAVAAADGHHHESVALRNGRFVVGVEGAAVPGCYRFPVGDGGCDEDVIAPDDRGRMPFARQFNLPTDVLGLAPLDRQVGVWCNAGAHGTAPLGPVVFRTRKHLVSRCGRCRQQPAYRQETDKLLYHCHCASNLAVGGKIGLLMGLRTTRPGRASESRGTPRSPACFL